MTRDQEDHTELTKDLASMMKLLIEDRRKREQEVADDGLCRENELADERRK